jgi:hypothetical protein
MQMVKTHAYNMCYLFVCDSVVYVPSWFMPCGVRYSWVSFRSCGAVISCLWWGPRVASVRYCGCVYILSCLQYGWQLRVYCSGGRDFLVPWIITVPWFCVGFSRYDPVLDRWRRWEDLFITMEVVMCNANNKQSCVLVTSGSITVLSLLSLFLYVTVLLYNYMCLVYALFTSNGICY